MTFKSIISAVLVTCFFLTSAVYAKSRENGEELERQLFQTVIDKNWKEFEGMLAPEVQSINSDKIRNRAELIKYVESIDFSKHDFSDFSVTKDASGNLQVVTYELTYKEKVDEEHEAGRKVKNLSVWKKTNGKWQWVAHAVLDKSMYCPAR